MTRVRRSFESAVFWIVMAILIACLVFVVSRPANATGRHDHGDTINQYNVFHKHHSGEDIAKGIAIGVVVTCGTVSLWTRAKHNRWTWCGEPQKPEPLPSPGPTPLTITPDPVGVKVYQ